MPDIELKRFMVFNPKNGQSEGREAEKLLYHWTKGVANNAVDLSEQIDDICMCDASVTTSERLMLGPLNSKADSQHANISGSKKRMDQHKSLVLNFDTTVILVYEAEPAQSIWIAIHVGPPPQNNESMSSSSSALPSHQTNPEDFPIGALKRILKNIYVRFCLLNGTFQMIADEVLQDPDLMGQDDETRRNRVMLKIREICEEYFNNVLPDIHLNSMITNIAALYNYILYLELNPLTLMKVNSFINHLVCTDANEIRYTIVIFNDQLLWSTMNMRDTRCVYNYLVAVLIRNALQEELSKETDKVRRIVENKPIHLSDSSNEQNNIVDEEWISPETHKLFKFYLTVFRSSNNLTLGLIFKSENQHDLIRRCEQILTSDSRFGVIPLASIGQSVGQNFLKTTMKSIIPTQPQAQLAASSQRVFSATASMTSSSSRRKQSASTSILRTSLSNDHKYLNVDHINASVSWPYSMEAPNKEQPSLLNLLDGGSLDAPTGSKARLIRHLIELDREIREIKNRTGKRLEEFLGKTTSDAWLMLTNSRYRSTFSILKVRNAGLVEAQQSAIDLRSNLAYNRN